MALGRLAWPLCAFSGTCVSPHGGTAEAGQEAGGGTAGPPRNLALVCRGATVLRERRPRFKLDTSQFPTWCFAAAVRPVDSCLTSHLRAGVVSRNVPAPAGRCCPVGPALDPSPA